MTQYKQHIKTIQDSDATQVLLTYAKAKQACDSDNSVFAIKAYQDARNDLDRVSCALLVQDSSDSHVAEMVIAVDL